MTTRTKIALASAALVLLVSGAFVIRAKMPPSSAPPLAAATLPIAAVDQDASDREFAAAGSRMRQIGILLTQAAVAHKFRFPASLGNSVPKFKPPATPAQIAAIFLTADDLKSVTIPDVIDAAWINAHTSYTYLVAGMPVVALNDGALSGQTIMVHTSLEKPFRSPDGDEVVLVTYVDGHVESLSVEAARAGILRSKREIAKATTRATN